MSGWWSCPVPSPGRHVAAQAVRKAAQEASPHHYLSALVHHWAASCEKLTHV